MRKLLNTLYVVNPDSYLALEGETVVVQVNGTKTKQIPLCNLQGIVCFGYMGCSPALMGKCAENDVSLCFVRQNGKFLARINGPVRGNVHLRRRQFEVLADPTVCLTLAQNVIATKLHNCRTALARSMRDNPERDNQRISNVINCLTNSVNLVYNCDSIDSVRGVEGEAARMYFSVYGELLNMRGFEFELRTRRPPLDNVNALLSYFYTIISLDVQSALETVGLDPYIGFLHVDRSGRPSLALDMVEELRTYFVDRFVANLVNLGQVSEQDFVHKEGGGVLMTDDTRAKILAEWQKRKRETITHPVIKQKVELGLIPYVQAQLLAKYLRGDLAEYPPFVMN